ncbi:MAG: HAMP domain-containing sensor histidine kinase [Blautia sp.]|nr:HAMP domain-containing sensor histidine kinase [Eubacteriales bacterium]MED9965748.1 HAMP domain-containing sensor histidine kinase [Blautia sp.]
MLILLCIFLGVSALFVILKLHVLHKALKKLTAELREINQDEPVHRHLQLPVPDRELELFAEELNRYLSCSFDRSFAQKKREQDVRREITNISHDLRTPLTSILGYLELLEDSPLSPEQQEYLEIIHNRSSHLNTLISQLYEYVRLESRELKLNIETLDLRLLLQEHLLSFYQEFEAKEISLIPQLPKEPVLVRADSDALMRILHNLTSNLLKYGAGTAAVSLTSSPKEAILTCSNQASDLTEDNAAHLFDPFYTADNARTTQKSGLGMTVSRLLLEQMGGSMDAHLENGILTITCRWVAA